MTSLIKLWIKIFVFISSLIAHVENQHFVKNHKFKFYVCFKVGEYKTNTCPMIMKCLLDQLQSNSKRALNKQCIRQYSGFPSHSSAINYIQLGKKEMSKKTESKVEHNYGLGCTTRCER